MQLSPLQWLSVALALGSAISMCVLFAVLLNRKRSTDLPIFTSYIAFGALVTFIGVISFFFASCHHFKYLGWLFGFLFVGLEFGVMYEIFANALKPYSALIDLGKLIFLWASAFLLIAATLTAFATVGSEQDRLTASVHVLERSTRLIECGLLLLFFLFEKRLGLSWKTPSISIALGLGVTASVDLIISYLLASITSWTAPLHVINTLAYMSVLGLWAYCMYQPTAACKNVLDSPNRLIFQRWNEVLSSYGYGDAAVVSGPADSFLPSVERTVERVMARKMVQ